MKIGFIGLGRMGLPMARNLLRAGHELVVFNRTRNRADALVAEGARVAAGPAEAARDAEALITMLADDAAVEQVIFGEDGALQALRPGAVHVSMSTISVALSERLAAAHEAAGQAYVAAPVFGRPEAAEAAKLWVVAAGPAEQIERCRPLFEAMGQGLFNVGPEAQRANLVKLAGNFLIASMVEALGEAFTLVRKSEVDPGQFLEIVSKVFGSPIYANYGRIIVEDRAEPAGFKLSLGLKDMRLVLAAADSVVVPLPLGSLLHDRLLAAMARGAGEVDWAAGLARRSAEDAGLG